MKVNTKKQKNTTLNSEDKLVTLLTKYINDARLVGMAISAKALSQVIYDITNDNKISKEEQINRIRKFCDVGINNDDKQKEILAEMKSTGTEIAEVLAEEEKAFNNNLITKKSAFSKLAGLFSNNSR